MSRPPRALVSIATLGLLIPACVREVHYDPRVTTLHQSSCELADWLALKHAHANYCRRHHDSLCEKARWALTDSEALCDGEGDQTSCRELEEQHLEPWRAACSLRDKPSVKRRLSVNVVCNVTTGLEGIGWHHGQPITTIEFHGDCD